ncbi:nucleoside-diphosphate-sugar epimerase [Tothia fuscella]|uniref:Nucleoside-diphosphate-sugar epimerase n=1 Tax=Tothia fuscella TaxID=1048955 RepID=A0A9P4P126_9PEZI|nr:nucleoside-diphosphate-sugar epimerase [Tothia fuscella]
MVKIFVIGATGYIGGDALFVIAEKHPEYEFTALVRNSEKGALVAARYPKIRLVYGDLDSSDLLTEEAEKADIVAHWANADHVGAAKALVKGLSSRSTPGYLIHTSGTGILGVIDKLDGTPAGTENPKVYDDWDGIGEVITLPSFAAHRNVDEIILAASKTASNVKTAIVCPPTIYGPGRGVGNTDSDQWYHMARISIERGKGFHVGEGKNVWTQVHVQDLSKIYLSLVEAAANGGTGATWNDEGYYLAEAGEYVWGEMAKKLAQEAVKQGYLQTDELESVTTDEADKLSPWGSMRWGTNSRGRAIRARKLFGWEPTGDSPEKIIPDIITGQAEKLGLKVGHALVAAGDA